MQEKLRFTRFGSQKKTASPGIRAKKTEIPALLVFLLNYLKKKLLSRDLISVPISTYFLANELLNEKGCLYFHVPHKCELPAAVYYMYIATCVYSVHMYIYVWPAISRSMKHEEQKSDEHLWTMNNNESDHIFYMPQICSSRWIFNRRKYMLTKKKILIQLQIKVKCK